MSYARVLDAIATAGHPPDLLDPDDPTAAGRWWDLRQHDQPVETWEADTIGPHGWLPIVAVPRPPDTETTTHDYSLVVVDGQPTETWTPRLWTAEELEANSAAVNAAQLTGESAEAVDKLVLVVENLNLITDLSNAEINANPAAIIKDVAREVKTVARQANREARLTSGTLDSTWTGEEIP